MKRFTGFKIILSVVFLLFLVQIAAAEQIYIPGTAYGGVQYTAQQSGIYKFTYESGAVRGPDCVGEIWCGCCAPGQGACWSGIIEIYLNRAISWGQILNWCPVVPSSPDYMLGTEHFYTVADAEAALKGTFVEIPLNKGDTLIFTIRDFETSYGDNTGGFTLDVTPPIVPDISGPWEGDMSNPGLEDYSLAMIITQNGDQISGTVANIITMSNAYPLDVGKHYTYTFTGTIDETGNIHIIGDFAEGPAEILARAGHWDMNWQLSSDGNTISFHGVTDGTYLDMLLHRQTSNQPPIADAGPDQTVSVGVLITLDGTGSSDPDNNLPLTYAWVMSAPSGSIATLSSTTVAKPTFMPDKSGDYVVTLTVKDSLELQSTVADDVKIITLQVCKANKKSNEKTTTIPTSDYCGNINSGTFYLESESGEKIWTTCENSQYQMYFAGSTGSTCTQTNPIGLCPYFEGWNTDISIKYVNNNDDPRPDCFLYTNWISRDYGWDDNRDLLEIARLDWTVSTFSVNDCKLMRSEQQYEYKCGYSSKNLPYIWQNTMNRDAYNSFCNPPINDDYKDICQHTNVCLKPEGKLVNVIPILF